MTTLFSVIGVIVLFELSYNTAYYSVLAQSNPISVNDHEPFAGFSVIRPAEIQIYVRRSGRLKVLIPFEIDVSPIQPGSGIQMRPANGAGPIRTYPASYNRPVVVQRPQNPIYYRPVPSNNRKPFPVLSPQYRPIDSRIDQNRHAWPQYNPAQRVDSVKRIPPVREYPSTGVVVQDPTYRNPPNTQPPFTPLTPSNMANIPTLFPSKFTQPPGLVIPSRSPITFTSLFTDSLLSTTTPIIHSQAFNLGLTTLGDINEPPEAVVPFNTDKLDKPIEIQTPFTKQQTETDEDLEEEEEIIDSFPGLVPETTAEISYVTPTQAVSIATAPEITSEVNTGVTTVHVQTEEADITTGSSQKVETASINPTELLS